MKKLFNDHGRLVVHVRLSQRSALAFASLAAAAAVKEYLSENSTKKELSTYFSQLQVETPQPA